MAELSDLALIRNCLSGDRRAFGEIVERYQTPVYNAALRILHDRHDAEDVTQTVFLKAYENLDSFDSNYKFFSWIYRIAVNESINWSKRKRPHDELDDVPSAAPDSHQSDAEETILRAIGHLSPEDRAVVILKHLEGFSYRDISYILEWPEKRVKSRLYTARQRLKNIVITLQETPRA